MAVTARDDPSPYWQRQIEELIELNAEALRRGWGLRVVLQVRPGGKIEGAICTQQPPCLDKARAKL